MRPSAFILMTEKVPVLAKGTTRTGGLGTYVRDDRPFGGHDPPAGVFFYSPDRGGKQLPSLASRNTAIRAASTICPPIWARGCVGFRFR